MKNISELLPIGSVVLLKDSIKRVMVMGVLQQAENDNQKVEYDYIGIPYPEGFMGIDKMFLFNHENIERTYFTGYDDFERTRFLVMVDEALKKGTTESTDTTGSDTTDSEESKS